jgi:preprotein translocase subunit SecD
MFEWKLWRWIISVLLTGFSIYFLVPSLVSKDANGNPILPAWWKGNLTERTISLGLDLQGGMHVDLEVDVPAALQSRMVKIGDAVKNTMTQRKVSVENVTVKDGLLLFQAAPDVQKQISDLVKETYPDLGGANGPQGTVAFKLTEQANKTLSDLAVRQALETIRNRIDQFGVREADVVRKGDDRVIVQLPGIKDPQRALDLIQNTAQLEFKLVDTSVPQSQLDTWLREVYAANPTLQTAPASAENIKALNDALAGKLPEGMEVLFMKSSEGRGRTPVMVQAKPLLTGDTVSNAEVRINTQYNEPYVGMEFDAEGARIFEQVTGDNAGRQLAIVLDNVVRSAPRINERIAGGSAQITGSFTMEEARDLAIALRSGALPAPVHIAEKRIVGPTLGEDSIHSGVKSVVVAALLILLFMVIYYRLSGLIADLALVLNIILIMGGLAVFEATLTLPGIAGIVLTIGMSIDANIIIFERVREELRLGKSPRAALEAGYNKALWTIIDAHVTALVSALVLFQFGTGPIKGFAVTLTIGIISSVFTAVIVSKMIFDAWIGKRKSLKTLSVGITVPQQAATTSRPAAAKGK